MTPFRLLKDNRGTLYEIPLLLMGYGVVCAVTLPLLKRSLPGCPSAGVIPLLFLGLGVFLLLCKVISIPRVRFFGTPAGLWFFVLLSSITLPFMWLNSEVVGVTATLLGQTYGSFRFDLWLADRKTRERQ
ncbi:MAG TPA: hypothetical protein P5551_07240 [Syntrophales bacterium]|nr:hypothetical protein [Syntrophales bacterium]HRT62137.1 hypothetical protein [Syntrophales bacterium]